MFKHILVPTDGSRVAAKAIKSGVALAKEIGAKVTGYHALPPLQQLYRGDSYVVHRPVIAKLERHSREAGEKYLAKIKKIAQTVGVAFTPFMTTAAAPHYGIIEAAKKQKCDVIFMASRGRGCLSSRVMGSVTQKVLASSAIPVLVYR